LAAVTQGSRSRQKHQKRNVKKTRWIWRVLFWIAALVVVFYAGLSICVVLLKFITPPTTSVQIQRRLESWREHKPYKKRYSPVPMSRISRDLQHAVVAAEDARFRLHHGIDWTEMQKVIGEDVESGSLGRGASTITQQLIKNIFLTTRRSLIRKGLEFTLVPLFETILGKDRILELYLNVIEWGPGVYGAEAAAHYYYNEPAARISREQAARLAAIIPNPLKRKPEHTGGYSADILARMRQMGW
jgi:monofunctional glycosyltransferase